MSNFKSETSKRIYETSIEDGMPEFIADCLVGQSKHETNNYKHKFPKLYKSYFGYSYNPKSKWQIKGGGSVADNNVKIAKYNSIEDSVHEITDWIKRRQKEGKFPADLSKIKTAFDYAKLLQDCGYYQGWKQYTKEENLKFYANGIQKGINDLE